MAALRKRHSRAVARLREPQTVDRRQPSRLLQRLTELPRLIEKDPEAMVAVAGANLRPVTWVRLQEFESGDWAIGGQRLTTSDVHALAKGEAA